MEGMSLLDRSRDLAMRRLAARRRPDTGELARAAGWGAASAFAGALLCLVPVVLGWIADDRSTTEWYSTLSIASSFWALAHRAHLWVSGDATRVVFAPLLVTVLAVLLARVGARGALGMQTDEAQDPWWLRPVAFVAGYALAGVLIDVIAASGPAGPSWWSV